MFKHIEQLKIDEGATSPYTVEEVRGEPVLHLAFAGRSNEKYFNARLRKAAAAGKKVKGKGKKQREAAAEKEATSLDRDRELFPPYVIKAWEGVVNDDGEEVPFSVEAAEQFVKALPDEIFEGVRMHAIDPANYREEQDSNDDEDDAELEKNS